MRCLTANYLQKTLLQYSSKPPKAPSGQHAPARGERLRGPRLDRVGHLAPANFAAISVRENSRISSLLVPASRVRASTICSDRPSSNHCLSSCALISGALPVGNHHNQGRRKIRLPRRPVYKRRTLPGLAALRHDLHTNYISARSASAYQTSLVPGSSGCLKAQ